jgi:hypothetical protein
MSYQYVMHDGSLLRCKAGQPPIGIELYVESSGEWIPFPEPADKAIGQSSIAAWFEGREVDEAEAGELQAA